jgi:predicted O-methyltransferase YrrM
MPDAQELESWSEMEDRLGTLLGVEDAALTGALADSVAAAMPAISVSPLEGRLLHLVARMIGARRVLEVGTLGGYSAIWLARALPEDGRLISLEIDPERARVARRSIERAGLGGRVEVRVGRAAESLAVIEAERGEAFDLVFIDADKRSNPDYLAAALRLTRPGSIIIVDNVVRRLEGDAADPDVIGTRRVVEMLGADPRLTATALQTVGRKGHDGFALALVLPTS